MTSYVPMKAHRTFYLGLILFAVGALIGCFIFLGTLVVAKAESTYNGSVPLVTFGALTAAIIAIFTIASGAIILIPTFLWSIGLIRYIDPLMYRHDLVGLRPLLAADQRRGTRLGVVRGRGDRLRRQADERERQPRRLPALHPVPAARQRAPPARRPRPVVELEDRQHQLRFYLAVLASMIHGLTVPGAIEVAQREKGFTKGLFEWLRKAPWGNPVFSGVFISIVGFGFLGGISGVMMGTEQLNMIIHNTIYVPGHFHATVVIGTTLAFMALTYFLIPALFRREMIVPGLAKWQPYLFGRRHVRLRAGHDGRGHARRVAPALGHRLRRPRAGLRVAGRGLPDDGADGIGGLLAIVGGAIYILVTVGSVLFGKRIETPAFQHVRAQTACRGRTGARRRRADGLRLGAASRRPAPSRWRWCSWWRSSCTTSSTGSTCRRCGR